MFTGIVQTLGRVAAREARGGDVRLAIEADAAWLAGVADGDSIAVNGCCLTVAARTATRFEADVSRETLALTTLDTWQAGTPVNLEKSLTLATLLGGHLVNGHVDGVGEVTGIVDDARSRRITFRASAALARYLARKGSVAVDGVSLTINAIDGATFEVNLVPHTLAHTVADGYAVGTRVNLEVDVVARYLERLLSTKDTP